MPGSGSRPVGAARPLAAASSASLPSGRQNAGGTPRQPALTAFRQRADHAHVGDRIVQIAAIGAALMGLSTAIVAVNARLLRLGRGNGAHRGGVAGQ